jgi:hypothetical protein
MRVLVGLMSGIRMIGFNALGLLGRLGNQMFQYASLKGIAANNNYNICIPPSGGKDEWREHQLFNCFNLSTINQLNVQYIDSNRPIVTESSFCFDENLFNNCPDWISIQGFFQSEKYFKNIKEEIKKDFSFKNFILDPALEAIQNFNNPVSLHIRRTDYKVNPNHKILSLDYYKKALDFFEKDRQIIIFTDDPKWAFEQDLFSDDRFIISEDQSNYMDLCLMTLCSDHIIANSSFSWWGAWLSESEKVIAPSGWFEGTNNSHLDTKDLIPSEWEIIL